MHLNTTGYSGAALTNMTEEPTRLQLSPIYAVFSMLISLWIIGSNFLVLVCFFKKRRDLMKTNFCFNILTLSVTDLIAGLSTLPTFVTRIGIRTHFEICIFRYVFFACAQVAVVFHILGICVDRLIAVSRLKKPNKPTRRHRVMLLYLSLVWTFTLILAVTVSIRLGTRKPTAAICSVSAIFQNRYISLLTFALLLYSVPFLMTNVVSFMIIIKLCCYKHNAPKLSTKLFNVHILKCSSSDTTAYQYENSQCEILQLRRTCSDTVLNLKENQKMSESSKWELRLPTDTDTFDKTKSPHEEASGFIESTTYSYLNHANPNTFRMADNNVEEDGDKINDRNDETADCNYINSAIKAASESNIYKVEQFKVNDRAQGNQRKALLAIGLVLCAFDVCVLPFILVFAVERFTDILLPVNVRVVACIFLTLNSAVNPIIYTCKLDCFRKALREVLQSICCCLCKRLKD